MSDMPLNPPTVPEFLENYLADFLHNYSHGLESLNMTTNGTPWFQTEEEAEEYLEELRSIVGVLK